MCEVLYCETFWYYLVLFLLPCMSLCNLGCQTEVSKSELNNWAHLIHSIKLNAFGLQIIREQGACGQFSKTSALQPANPSGARADGTQIFGKAVAKTRFCEHGDWLFHVANSVNLQYQTCICNWFGWCEYRPTTLVKPASIFLIRSWFYCWIV